MDNLDRRAILGMTQNEDKQQQKTHITKANKMSNIDQINNYHKLDVLLVKKKL